MILCVLGCCTRICSFLIPASLSCSQTGLIPDVATTSKIISAFLIASDTLAVGVLQAFNEENINVPKDTAILSINNSNVVKYVSPPLSSYNINQQEMIDLALTMLTNLIIQPDRAHIDVNMNTNLVVRKSFIPKGE